MRLRAGSLHHKRPRAGGPWGRGFTLIELVLVMLIVVIAIGVVAPSLSGFLSGRKTVNAVNQILSLARHGRSQALAEGKVYRLNIDTRSNEYWLEIQDGGLYSELSNEHGQRHKLPDGMTATWRVDDYAPVFPVNTINTQQTRGGLSSAGAASGGSASGAGAAGNQSMAPAGGGRGDLSESYVTFYPDGRHDSLILTLDDGNGDKIELGAYSETENWGVLKEEER